jgi:pyridoxal phosphate-dependent aminotransferase EpsN
MGAKPVFVDSEPESWNMSPTALERALTDAANTGTLPKEEDVEKKRVGG